MRPIEWIRCPKCGSWMIGLTGGNICPLCGYRVPVQTITTTTGTSEEYVPVIRCKECTHHKDQKPGMVYCPHIVGGWVDEDCYCSWAERREK